jgi:hypothetical protein
MSTPDELTTVATFSNTAEADLARERLELEGIRAFVLGAVTASVVPHISDLGEIALQVATEDAERAREALNITAE